MILLKTYQATNHTALSSESMLEPVENTKLHEDHVKVCRFTTIKALRSANEPACPDDACWAFRFSRNMPIGQNKTLPSSLARFREGYQIFEEQCLSSCFHGTAVSLELQSTHQNARLTNATRKLRNPLILPVPYAIRVLISHLMSAKLLEQATCSSCNCNMLGARQWCEELSAHPVILGAGSLLRQAE